MGYRIAGKCLACGERFDVDHDGGFVFHLVRCDTCGETKSMSFDELGELHLRYLKGLSVPYSVVTKEHDEHVRRHAKVEPISEDDYHRGVEALAGNCQCGGKYGLDAPPRCPKCRSTEIEEGPPIIMYD